MNTCYNALDYHIENGRGSQDALIYDSPVTDTIRKYTYLELRDEVARFAGVLVDQGVAKGDRVIIYMPMIAEAAIAMLACARIGAVHSVVFGGFAAKELATRINDAKPKVIVSASCGIEVKRVIAYKPLLDQAIDFAESKPEKCVIFQRPMEKAPMVDGRDVDWTAAMESATPQDCVPVAATDPLYILYTSGTTGEPKGVVRDNGGHMVALKWTHEGGIQCGRRRCLLGRLGCGLGGGAQLYRPTDRCCGAAPPSSLKESRWAPPMPGSFWRVISQHKVKMHVHPRPRPSGPSSARTPGRETDAKL